MPSLGVRSLWDTAHAGVNMHLMFKNSTKTLILKPRRKIKWDTAHAGVNMQLMFKNSTKALILKPRTKI